MSDYRAAISGGYKALSQTAYSQADGATPFSGVAAGRAYTLQVLTGTLKINFTGATSAYFELGPGIYSDAIAPENLKTAKVDATSNYTAILMMQGTI